MSLSQTLLAYKYEKCRQTVPYTLQQYCENKIEAEEGKFASETGELIELPSRRIFTKNTHGTGCTLSSAVAAYLARGFSLNESVTYGKEYIYQAILAGTNFSIGKGHGPVHHFWNVPNWGEGLRK